MTSLLSAATIDGLTAAGNRWLPVMLDATIKGTAVLAVAGAALLAMRRTSAAARQLVLLIALVGLLIVPIVSLALPGWAALPVLPAWARFESPTEPPAQATEAVSIPVTPDVPAMLQSNQITSDPWPPDYTPIEAAASPPAAPIEPVAKPAASPLPPAQPAAVRSTPSPIQKWIGFGLVAWAAGVAVCLLPLVLGRISIWRLKRGAVPVADGPLWDMANKAQAQLGLKGRVSLLISHRRAMPMMWGIVRPALLLPAEAVEWSAGRLWVVMLHELGHVKRWDMLTKVLAHLAAAFYWFNPLVWLALRQFQTESERACDDLVLAAGNNPGDYAEHILNIASGLQTQMFAAHGSIAMARPNRLEGRLLAILDPRRSRRRLSLMLVLLAAVLGTAVLVPLSVLRARDAAADKPAKAEPATEADTATAPPATQPERAVGWSEPVKGLRWRAWLSSGKVEAGGTVEVNIEFQNVSDQPLRLFKDVTTRKSVYPTVFTADGEKDVLPIEHPHELNIRDEETVLVIPKGTYRARWQLGAPQVPGATKLWFYYDAPINTNHQVKGFWTGMLPGLTLEFTIIAPGQTPPATQPGGAGNGGRHWAPTEDYPAGIVEQAEKEDRQMSATPWAFEGTTAKVFADGAGRYRVTWVRKDPLRKSYSSAWYEFRGQQRAHAGAIESPSQLTSLDIRDAPSWNADADGAPATQPAADPRAELEAAAELLRKAGIGEWKITDEGRDIGLALPALALRAKDSRHDGLVVLPFPHQGPGVARFREWRGQFADVFVAVGTNDRWTLAGGPNVNMATAEVVRALNLTPLVETEFIWGEPVDGLETRLTLERREAAIGEQVYVHLDVRNFGDKPIELAFVKHLSRFLRVQRVDGVDVPVNDKSEFTVYSKSYPLEPGKQDEAICDLLDRTFDLSQPGEYTIQWVDAPAKFTTKGQAPPPSNVVRLKIVADRTASTAPAESPKWLNGSEWSKASEGLQTRLAVPERTLFHAGRPIPMRVELRNVGDKPVNYVAATPYRRGLIAVTERAGKELPFLEGGGSMGPGTVILLKPGEQVVLGHEFDLAQNIYLRKAGTYTVRYAGEWALSGVKNRPLPPSPPLEIEVIDDPAARADGDPVGRLLSALPADWSLWGSTTIESYLLRPGAGWGRVHGGYVQMVHKDYWPKGRDGGPAPAGVMPILVWIMQERAKEESWQPGKDPLDREFLPTECLGGSRFYHVYVHVPESAAKTWPTAAKDIAKTLAVSPPTPDPRPEASERVGYVLDEPLPATRPDVMLEELSPLARKLAASLPAGWKLFDCGRCDAPNRWSGKTDCEYLRFVHRMLKFEDGINPANFTVWLTPGDYKGEELPSRAANPGGAHLAYIRADLLLFLEGLEPADKQASKAVEKVFTDVLGFTRNHAFEGRLSPPTPPDAEPVKPISEDEALGRAAAPATQPAAGSKRITEENKGVTSYCFDVER